MPCRRSVRRASARTRRWPRAGQAFARLGSPTDPTRSTIAPSPSWSSPNMPRLEGKVAIVTGAASGIGQATADLFRSEGATVVAADRTEGVDLVKVDAGSEVEIEQLVQQTVADHGGIDIFFANAGISGGLVGLFEQSVADWEEILRVNLIGPWLAIKYAAPHMKERGSGSIIC